MQIMVEGLALAAFGMMRLVMPNEPLIQDITSRIMADESRHVAFGVMACSKVYSEEMSARELARARGLHHRGHAPAARSAA